MGSPCSRAESLGSPTSPFSAFAAHRPFGFAVTSTRHVLQNYPYKYRAINTVLMGVVAASSRVVADRLYCHQFNAPLEPLAPSNSKAAAVAAAGTPHDRPQPLESSGKREKVAGEGRTGSAATAPADSPGIFGWLQKRAEERRARKGSAAVDGASAASAASASSAELGTTDRGARARDAPPAETEAASEPDEGGGLAASVESDAVPESAAEAEAAEAESEAESDSLADRADASAKSGERLALPTSFSRVGDGAYSSSSSSFGNPGAYAGASSSSLPTDPFAAADSDVVEDLQPDEDKYAGDSSREA